MDNTESIAPYIHHAIQVELGEVAARDLLLDAATAVSWRGPGNMDDDHIAVETVRLLAARLYTMQNPAGGS
jgi:hypothetical protein